MQNLERTLILAHWVGFRSITIHKKFEANTCSGWREVERVKKVYDDGHRVIASHTHP